MPRFKDSEIEEKRKLAASEANKKRFEKFRREHPKYCAQCGKLIDRLHIYGTGKYCSKECMVIGKHNSLSNALKGKSYKEKYGDQADEMRKKCFEWRWGDGRPIGIPYKINDDWYIRFETDDGIVNERYHRWLWIQNNGPIPEGCVIHHINKNHDDNRLENLECISRAEHANIHRKENKWDRTGCNPWNKKI